MPLVGATPYLLSNRVGVECKMIGRGGNNDDIQDPHLRFYTMCDREGNLAFDDEYVWTRREHLSQVLVSVHQSTLFPGGTITHLLDQDSPLSTARSNFTLDISWSLKRATSGKRVDLLRTILCVDVDPAIPPEEGVSAPLHLDTLPPCRPNDRLPWNIRHSLHGTETAFDCFACTTYDE